MSWSQRHIKKRIDQDIFELEDNPSEFEKKIIGDLRFHCEGVFENLERVARVKEKVTEVKERHPELDSIDLITDDILDELDEIVDDIHFSTSHRGPFLSIVSDYAEEVYRELRQNKEYENILIGAHAEKECIIVSGTLDKQEDFIAAIEIISKYPVYVPMNYDVVIGG